MADKEKTEPILVRLDESMDPTPIGDLTKEQLAELFYRTNTALEELTAQKSVIREELIAKMGNLNADIIAEYQVEWYMKRGDFDLTLEEAEHYDAVQTKMTLNTEKLKELEKEGVKLKRKPAYAVLKVKPI